MAELNLKDKVVLITGASSGIGAATAIEFAKYDVRLSLTGRKEQNLLKTIEKCKQQGLSDDKIFYVLGDLTKESEVQHILDSTVKHYGRIDKLCNIAGEGTTGSFEKTTPQLLHNHIEWMVMPYFYMCKAAMPLLYETQGVIVNMGSTAALRATATQIAYNMCRTATDQLTKCIALEAASKGVRVNAVDPGAIWNTNIWERAGTVKSDEELIKFRNKIEGIYPMLRVGVAREVAELVVFLASDQAKFITGVQFPIDGCSSIVSQHMMETNKTVTLQKSNSPLE